MNSSTDIVADRLESLMNGVPHPIAEDEAAVVQVHLTEGGNEVGAAAGRQQLRGGGANHANAHQERGHHRRLRHG